MAQLQDKTDKARRLMLLVSFSQVELQVTCDSLSYLQIIAKYVYVTGFAKRLLYMQL